MFYLGQNVFLPRFHFRRVLPAPLPVRAGPAAAAVDDGLHLGGRSGGEGRGALTAHVVDGEISQDQAER